MPLDYQRRLIDIYFYYKFVPIDVLCCLLCLLLTMIHISGHMLLYIFYFINKKKRAERKRKCMSIS